MLRRALRYRGDGLARDRDLPDRCIRYVPGLLRGEGLAPDRQCLRDAADRPGLSSAVGSLSHRQYVSAARQPALFAPQPPATDISSDDLDEAAHGGNPPRAPAEQVAPVVGLRDADRRWDQDRAIHRAHCHWSDRRALGLARAATLAPGPLLCADPDQAE